MSEHLDKLKTALPQSEQGNFYIKDSIGVPHPYCIGPKHLEYSTDMYLDIEEAESKGAKCCTCKGKLTYKQHEQAVLIGCKVDTKDPADETKGHPELHAYLLALKPLFEADKVFVGFAFVDESGHMSTFTKGNYEFVAKIMSSVQPTELTHARAHGDAMAQWERTCLAFLNQFKQDNPNFDRERFLNACKGDT